jgi:hypothetical protein
MIFSNTRLTPDAEPWFTFIMSYFKTISIARLFKDKVMDELETI